MKRDGVRVSNVRIKNVHGNTLDHLGEAIVSGRHADSLPPEAQQLEGHLRLLRLRRNVLDPVASRLVEALSHAGARSLGLPVATLGEGSVGEIRIQGDSLYQGYFNRPDLTEKALRDGWYSTGDLGFLLEEAGRYVERQHELYASESGRMLREDLLAGLTGALIVLPQGVAFATIAGLPPEYGLYAAMIPAIVAALYGSSWHLVSGPTTAISIAIYGAVHHLAEPGTPQYVGLILTLTLQVGIFQVALGLARMGALVNFISHTVVIGFTTGAAVLIAASQIRAFFGIQIARGLPFYEILHQFALQVDSINPWVLGTGLVTLAAGLATRRWWKKFPYMIAAMLAGSLVAYALNSFFGAAETGIRTVGALPTGLPPLAVQVQVEAARASEPIADVRIAIRDAAGEYAVLPGTRWREPATELVRNLLVHDATRADPTLAFALDAGPGRGTRALEAALFTALVLTHGGGVEQRRGRMVRRYRRMPARPDVCSAHSSSARPLGTVSSSASGR